MKASLLNNAATTSHKEKSRETPGSNNKKNLNLNHQRLREDYPSPDNESTLVLIRNDCEDGMLCINFAKDHPARTIRTKLGCNWPINWKNFHEFPIRSKLINFHSDGHFGC